MAKLTPQEAADKYGQRMKAAVADIRRGVERVTEAPGAKAAAKADKWHARLTAEETKQKYIRRVGAVSLSDWKAQTLNKGVGRIAAGVDAANAKMASFFGELFPYQESLKGQIDTMPDTTIEDSVNRAAFWIRGMAKFERRG